MDVILLDIPLGPDERLGGLHSRRLCLISRNDFNLHQRRQALGDHVVEFEHSSEVLGYLLTFGFGDFDILTQGKWDTDGFVELSKKDIVSSDAVLKEELQYVLVSEGGCRCGCLLPCRRHRERQLPH